MAENQEETSPPLNQPTTTTLEVVSHSLGQVLTLHDQQEVAVADSKGSADLSRVNNTNNRSHSHTDMVKLIYIHVATMGSTSEEGSDGEEWCDEVNQTNEWYVMKRGSDGGLSLLPAFGDIKPLNSPNNALIHTPCQVIGSCIYVIGGCNVSGYPFDHITDSGSNKIRRLDTRNPTDGWKTIATLPFNVCESRSTAVSNQLHIFSAHPHYCNDPQEPWGYALNLDDNESREEKQGVKIAPPGNSTHIPVVSALSPTSLVVYMDEEATFYQLDCTNNDWSVYDHKDLHDDLTKYFARAVVCDGILYIYDNSCMTLTYYDIRNKREIDVVEIPPTSWFGIDKVVDELIVLSKNKFCIIWHGNGWHVNTMNVYYSKFSVSYDEHREPTVVLEENQLFTIGGYEMLNVVAM